MDVMVNEWGKPFVRIKERKNGNDIGAIIIPKEDMDQFLHKMANIRENLPSYTEERNGT